MSKVYNVRNGGDPSVLLGQKVVGSYNLAPVGLTATSSGYQMTQADINNYEIFSVAQTSADTDKILLPVTAPIGTLVVFVATSVARVKAGADSSGLTINNAADTTSVPLVVGARTEFRKQSATNWACNHFSIAGAVTAPTPSYSGIRID